MPTTVALIMAAGAGARLSGETRKPFVLLGGRPMIVWSIERFAAHDDIDAITVITRPGDEEEVRGVLERHGVKKVDRVIAGGERRQESVRLGLDGLPDGCDAVLVHDAARPCLSAELLDSVLNALRECDAVVPVVPAVDTLIREDGGRIDAILDRVKIAGAQTPQGFRKDVLVRAHRRALSRGVASSDDGALVFALGETVRTIPGERTNIKVTYQEDLRIAEAIIGGFRLP